jgi:membrane associated rhomboid family serine protease
VLYFMARESQSILMPTSAVLVKFGAKDLPLIAQGEYWRLATPVFVHIGLLHFIFNSMGLYYIGSHLESLIGAGWFLAVYLLSGIFGNIASVFFSVAVSAGASGALFGLLGSGVMLERLVGHRIEKLTGRKPQRSAYLSMAVVNIAFGLIVPGIDNAAHLGGLVGGLLLTLAMLSFRRNQLMIRRPARGIMIFAGFTLISGTALWWSLDDKRLLGRYLNEAHATQDPAQQVYLLSQALRVMASDTRVYLERGRILLLHDEISGLEDIRVAARDFRLRQAVFELIDELRAADRGVFADAVQEIVGGMEMESI